MISAGIRKTLPSENRKLMCQQSGTCWKVQGVSYLSHYPKNLDSIPNALLAVISGRARASSTLSMSFFTYLGGKHSTPVIEAA